MLTKEAKRKIREEIIQRQNKSLMALHGPFDVIHVDGIPTNVAICRDGIVIDVRKGQFRMPIINDSGTLSVHMRYETPDGVKWTTRLLKNIIAETYINEEQGNSNSVECKDGNECNCRLDNLKWKPRTIVRGTKHSKALYSEAQIKEVCKLIDEMIYPPSEIATLTGVSEGVINSIRNRTAWVHISSAYLIPECQYTTGPKPQLIGFKARPAL